VPNSNNYLLYVKDSSGIIINKSYTAAQANCAGGTGVCSVVPATALEGCSATWWVQASNYYGSGPWSDGMVFTMQGPGKATLLSPSGPIDTTKPTYTWEADAQSTWYWLWVNDSTGNRINKWYTATHAGCAGGAGTCAITPDVLLSGSCKWWVQTWKPGCSGPWSDAGVFTVPKVTLISPSGTITTTTPTYSWHADPDATWYYLWVNDSTGNKIKKWYTSAQAGCADGTGTCSVTPTTPLALGSGTWWVQTYNANGYGPWSDGMTFQVSTP
jgi:hypothetical protein